MYIDMCINPMNNSTCIGLPCSTPSFPCPPCPSCPSCPSCAPGNNAAWPCAQEPRDAGLSASASQGGWSGWEPRAGWVKKSNVLQLRPNKKAVDQLQMITTGWWFGCHLDFFPINIGLRLSSQLTKSYFSEGWRKTTNQSYNWSLG